MSWQKNNTAGAWWENSDPVFADSFKQGDSESSGDAKTKEVTNEGEMGINGGRESGRVIESLLSKESLCC